MRGVAGDQVQEEVSINKILEEDLQRIHESFEERSKLTGSTVLITGCAGFLGFAFLNYFLAYAEELGLRKVIGLDNFLLSRPKWLDDLEKQHKHKLELQKFDIVTDDIASIPGADEAGYVLHLASIASPTFYRRYPIETIDANIWGLRRLLDFYQDRGLQGLLFFSSSEIYGDPVAEAIPTPESYNGNVASIGPRACYDEAKRFGETICYNFAEKFEMPITVARPFNNYGPGMSLEDKRVPADFAKAALEGRNIEIFSDGTPTRTFCYITDAITGYLKILTHGRFDVFNIGIEKPEISIRDFAELNVNAARDLFGHDIQAEFEPPPEANYLTHNPNRRCPDISKARKLLNYNPVVSVEEGIPRFLKYLAGASKT